MNDELCNPALWSSSATAAAANAVSQQPHQHQAPPPPLHSADSDASDAAGGGSGGSGGSLDEARHRYKIAVAALRASIAAVSPCTQVRTYFLLHLVLTPLFTPGNMKFRRTRQAKGSAELCTSGSNVLIVKLWSIKN
jgi:hypothetical protein